MKAFEKPEIVVMDIITDEVASGWGSGDGSKIESDDE